jgi:membrane-associated protease RseP (regulator of RpoE activity)
MPILQLIPSILIMLVLISILIIAHELGHFYVAKRCGVRVERFGFGLPFGPTLWSKTYGGTEYCIHLLMFGGYVAFPDDSPESDVPMDSTERFENQPVLNRAAIAVAGVTVNAIMAWALMFFITMGWGVPSIAEANVAVRELVSESSPAAVAGVHSGDAIVAVNGVSFNDKRPLEERMAGIKKIVQSQSGQTVHLSIRRFNKDLMIDVPVNAKGQIGIVFGYLRKFTPVDNPIDGAVSSVETLNHFVYLNFVEIGKLFTNFDSKKLGGPLRIISDGAMMINVGGIQEGLFMAAAVSIILAVMNLLPIPALDGGHILFITLEAIKGKPVRKEIQERFVQVGFMVLLSMMAFIFCNDIYNMFFASTAEDKLPVKQEVKKTDSVKPDVTIPVQGNQH